MTYTTPELTEQQVHQHVFNILQQLNGLPLSQVQHILSEAQHMASATTIFNCQSDEHLAAKQGFQGVSP